MNTVVNDDALLGALEAVLRRIPGLTSLAVEREVEVAGGRPDALLGVALRGLDAQRWVVESKAHPVEPNAARLLVMRLSEAAAELHTDYAVVVTTSHDTSSALSSIAPPALPTRHRNRFQPNRDAVGSGA